MSSTPNWGKAPWRVSFRSKRTSLPGHVDVAIIGGGFTGLSAAAIAKRLAPQKSILLLEADRIGNGASGRTGGMVLAESAAGNLPGLGNVIRGYKKILRNLHIRADLELPGVWEIARGRLSMEGKPVRPLPDSPIRWNDSGEVRAVKKVSGGSVDPGKVVSGLARAAKQAGALIAENAKVVGIELGKPLRLHVSCKHHGRMQSKMITADRVLQSTNAGNLPGKYFEGEPKLTFALATAPLNKRQLATLGLASGKPFYTVDIPYLWGRKLKNGGVVFGSGLVPAFGQSLSGKTSNQLWSGLERESILRGAASQRLRTLEHRVRQLHPALHKVRITHRWCGPILLTRDFVPIFRHHPKSKNLVLLRGFSGHGVALSVYLGEWAALAVLGKRSLPKWHTGG
ncbi:MAG TPA: FAD-binding oxidoreductase [Candidatus Eremiobacteraceae bacterium]|nr:FAD-binding oxidoreductase [Candidatus Eremiobacteraceae bacterium]